MLVAGTREADDVSFHKEPNEITESAHMGLAQTHWVPIDTVLTRTGTYENDRRRTHQSLDVTRQTPVTRPANPVVSSTEHALAEEVYTDGYPKHKEFAPFADIARIDTLHGGEEMRYKEYDTNLNNAYKYEDTEFVEKMRMREQRRQAHSSIKPPHDMSDPVTRGTLENTHEVPDPNAVPATLLTVAKGAAAVAASSALTAAAEDLGGAIATPLLGAAYTLFKKAFKSKASGTPPPEPVFCQYAIDNVSSQRPRESNHSFTARIVKSALGAFSNTQLGGISDILNAIRS
jgi:hypothetical protein